jgi:hypothetical protein
MEEVLLKMDSEEDPENPKTPSQFIIDLYDIVCKKHHRDEKEGVYPSDFFYDMFHSDVGNVWWMSCDHPFASMLKHSNIMAESTMTGVLGDVIVYRDVDVRSCRSSIMGYCAEFGLKIK